METFFAEHFAAGAADYIVYIASDWPSAEERYREIFSWRDSPSSCLDYAIPAVLFVILPCEETLSSLAWLHFWNLQEQTAPRANPYTPGADGVHPQGADWLHLGTRQFAHYAYLRSVQPEMASRLRGRLLSSASHAGESLREIESQTRTHYLSSLLSAWEARGFLAAEWLAERAGAPALLDYYRVAGSSGDWRHAFERPSAQPRALLRDRRSLHQRDRPAHPAPRRRSGRARPRAPRRRRAGGRRRARGVRGGAAALLRAPGSRRRGLHRLRRLRRRVGRSRVPEGVLPGPRPGILLHGEPGLGARDDARLREDARPLSRQVPLPQRAVRDPQGGGIPRRHPDLAAGRIPAVRPLRRPRRGQHGDPGRDPEQARRRRAPRRTAPRRVRAHLHRGADRTDPDALLLRRGVDRRARRREGDLRLPATALPVGELAGDLRGHLRHHRRGLLRGVRGVPRRPGPVAAAGAAAPRRRHLARAGGRRGWLEPGDRTPHDHHRPPPGLGTRWAGSGPTPPPPISSRPSPRSRGVALWEPSAQEYRLAWRESR